MNTVHARQGAAGRNRSFRTCAAAALGMLAVAWCAVPAWGFGVGHADQAELVMSVLPKDVVDFFGPELRQKIVREYSHYPDSVGQFKDETYAAFGPQAAELLRRHGIQSGNALHDHETSMALCLVLLNRALLDKNPQRAAIWTGSLIHLVGDNASHITLMAYLSQISRFQIKVAPGVADFSTAAQDPLGRQQIRRLMDGFTPHTIGGEPDESIRKMITLMYEGMDYAAQRDSRIGGSFNPTYREDALLAMSELGAWGAQRAADAIVTAWGYARQGKALELKAETIKKAGEECRAFLASKPLEHDTVYAGTLDSRPAGRAVGVLVEPSSVMGRARFGYCGAVHLAMIMRELRREDVPYRPIDIRVVEKDGLPPADQVPLLVVCSGGFYCSPDPFKKYVDAGGRLLWIGGRDKGLLGKLSSALQPANARIAPVSAKYEDPNKEVVARVSISFAGELGRAVGAEPMRFVNNPNIGGWTTPHCDLQIVSTDPNIRVLATVSDGTETMNVAAALVENGKARHVFLPVYLLVPFVLSKDHTTNFSQPTLDSVGQKIIETSVKMLAAEMK